MEELLARELAEATREHTKLEEAISTAQAAIAAARARPVTFREVPTILTIVLLIGLCACFYDFSVALGGPVRIAPQGEPCGFAGEVCPPRDSARR